MSSSGVEVEDEGAQSSPMLYNARSALSLNKNNPFLKTNRLSNTAETTRSVGDLSLLIRNEQRDSHTVLTSTTLNNSTSNILKPNKNSSIITPTNARFEFARPLNHQVSNSSISSTSVSNLNNNNAQSPIRAVVSPDKSVMNSIERNAKYLSVIDLYDDDSASVPSPAQQPQANTPRHSLRIEHPAMKTLDTKESIYSPTSVSSFNFVSKNFDDSSDELPLGTINDLGQANPIIAHPENRHRKQETLYYSPQNSLNDVVLANDGVAKGAVDLQKSFSEASNNHNNSVIIRSPESIAHNGVDNKTIHVQGIISKDTELSDSKQSRHPSQAESNLQKQQGDSSSSNTKNKAANPFLDVDSLSGNNSSEMANIPAELVSVTTPAGVTNINKVTNSKITPISYATTPSINLTGSPLAAISANVTQSLSNFDQSSKKHAKGNSINDLQSATSNVTAGNSSNINVRNFINNNHSLLSVQLSKESSLPHSNVVQIESVSRNLLIGDRDRYGFKKKTSFVNEQEYNNWWMQYEPYLIRRKKKWETLMSQNGLNLNKDNPARFPARSNKLKRYVRKGIPAEWRGNAWWYFARGYEKLESNPGLYDKIIDNISGIKTHDAEIIERDLNRTFPDNMYFRSADQSKEETPLIQSLRRVLVAFAIYQPQIGYCQSLNFLAGLLLIFLDEERAFWMLVIITSRLLPGVHDVNLEGVNIDQGVLMLCVKEYLPNVWNKIGFNFDSNGMDGKQSFNNEVNVVTKLPPITLCTASWFMSAFIGILPIETCLRVWDCFFYEESKVFFRIALSILKLAEPRVEKIKDEMEVFQIIQNFPKKLLEPKDLFECCFKKRNGFSNLTQEEINRCRKFVKEQRQKASKSQISTKAASGNNKGKSTDELNDVQKLRKEMDENFIPEEYDFKKNGLAGAHWKTTLSKKIRKQKIKGHHMHF
ncbi:Rab GTPase-activating protein [Saccharomycopsis crataegensis]|uniref:Rab GTPase-activating protein n=1 Tax=Saccharomycopsis crataegensis TaxID=43959 RepID=A0AAV5QMM7_9ASCO|nr:Rab GTPase-activating protein [Saccharomycopsis crataegensis]